MENLLNIVTEHQALFDERQPGFAERQARYDEMLEAQRLRHDKEISDIRELQNAFAAGMIRLQESHQHMDRELEALKETVQKNAEASAAATAANVEAQRVTEEKLKALIDIVDRIIRDRNR